MGKQKKGGDQKTDPSKILILITAILNLAKALADLIAKLTE